MYLNKNSLIKQMKHYFLNLYICLNAKDYNSLQI